MRAELEGLVERSLAGERDCCQALFRLLDNCLGLEQESPQRWKGQPEERTWPDNTVQAIAPELTYFLPTPAELEETKRRLRLHLWRDGRLDANVLGTLGHHADRAVFYPLVDLLEAYDGDRARYDEIEATLQAVADAASDVGRAGLEPATPRPPDWFRHPSGRWPLQQSAAQVPF